MTKTFTPGADQATVYTRLGQTLRVALPAGTGHSPERQLARWLNRQTAANPGFPARVRSVLLLVRRPPCAECRQPLDQTLRRWNLAGRLRVVVVRPADEAWPAAGCACAGALPAAPATYYADEPLAAGEPAQLELEGSYGSEATHTFPLEGAGAKIKARGWDNGIYVIKKNNTPIYVGKSIHLGTRVQQHALSLTHLLIKLDKYTVQVYYYPSHKGPKLKAQEDAHYQRLKKLYKLGNAVSPELEISQELNELTSEYEALSERFRQVVLQNPVRPTVYEGLLAAASPLLPAGSWLGKLLGEDPPVVLDVGGPAPTATVAQAQQVNKHRSPAFLKAKADLKRQSIDNPDLPRADRGWLRQERNQRGNNPRRWRNPPGKDVGHVDPTDNTRVRWEGSSENRSRGARFKRETGLYETAY